MRIYKSGGGWMNMLYVWVEFALMRDYDGNYINERYNGGNCDNARLEWLGMVRKYDGYEGNDRW